MRSETNGCRQVQVPTKGGGFGTNYVPTRVQGLKSHKPDFADELVRSNEKGPPSEPSTYHILPPQNLACPHDNCIDE